jgi:hypothetical protein
LAPPLMAGYLLKKCCPHGLLKSHVMDKGRYCIT